MPGSTPQPGGTAGISDHSSGPGGDGGSLLGHERKEKPRVLLGLHHHIAI